MTPAYANLLRQREERRHVALVRDGDGNLQVRRYNTGAEAATASMSREWREPETEIPIVTRPRRREWRLSEVARELGISARTLKAYLPYLKHRQPSPKVTYLSGSEVILLKLHGTHGVRRLRLAQGI